MTDINIEEIANEVAHRTCTKYVHDGELRYQFNDRHVVDFATRIIAAVDKARAEQNPPVAWREASCGDEGTCCYTYNEMGKGEPLFSRPQEAVSGLLEIERLRLAACGTAALGYFNGCADEYKSASLTEVLELRARYDALIAAAPTYKEKEDE